MFRTERDQNPRIEWKKKGKDVSFVYFDGHFRGEKAACRSLSPAGDKQVICFNQLAVPAGRGLPHRMRENTARTQDAGDRNDG